MLLNLRRSSFGTLCLAMFLLSLLLAVPATASDKAEIQDVIQRAYIEGIHINGDSAAIRSGFHPSFVMFIQRDGEIRQVLIEDWISRIEESQKEAGDSKEEKPKVKADIDVLDLVGAAAVARVRVHKDGKQVYTDFMSLYRFDDGWKIVAKTFHSHR